MKEYVICKSCGFIMGKKKLKDKCPACGVNSKMFEPYTEKISDFRRFALSLDLHPVLVHFPQAFAITLFFLSLSGLFFQGYVREKILSAIVVLGFALPFVIVAAICAGLFDGKIRFHKVTTTILIKKMILAFVFFIISIAIFILTVFNPVTQSILLVTSALAIIASACSAFLGLLGSSIINAKLPG